MPPLISDETRLELERQRMAGMYKEMFGVLPAPGDKDMRTPLQVAIWEDLSNAACMNMAVFTPDKTGALDPFAGSHRDGRRWLFLYIRGNVLPTRDPVQQ
jgi:hypothetical protein